MSTQEITVPQRQSHGVEVIPVQFGRPPYFWCDCQRRFPAMQHAVEKDHYESPEWAAHVKRERAAGRSIN